MRKFLLCFLFLLIVTACSNGTSIWNQKQQKTASWAYQFIKWNGVTYVVTGEKIKTVGKEIGSVSSYSDKEDTIQSGVFSNKYPVGTKFFEIVGTDIKKAIAVEEKGRIYIKAINENEAK
ncbi:hypothetical protein DFP93_103215 [Aneurinibacillus soli]|uniref:Uncharacterized protein n=1 Tax=Aneurinibacillus soli TaxID=1500254 RepID=A0A0U5AYV1_9BACL|nr:hypothetical protein [Aneurinibacillus soli]PYE63003.1 hypothetical protein DFP93_103215 [Aneurinibacillus soli]BAU28938.1 hypothetical protein CB4_03115 [Aneurinibacillus soli]